MTSKIEISHRTIIFTTAFLAAIWLILKIKDILFLLFISFIIMAAVRPLVDRLEKFRIPRAVAIVLIYILIFGLLGVSFAGIIPALVIQTARFIADLPTFVSRVLPYWNIDVGAMSSQIAPISENIVRVTVGIFSNIITTVTVLVFTFYFLLEHKYTGSYLSNFVGESGAKQIMRIVGEVEERLGAWVQGELLLMTIIGVLSFVGLTILHVEFALPLAIIAGVLEAVPMVGPIISAIPAIFVALTVSPFLAASVVALYFIIQQVENNFIVPLVMKKSTGISPLLTILALMVGGRLGGVVGAILAIPAVLVLGILFQEFVVKKQ